MTRPHEARGDRPAGARARWRLALPPLAVALCGCALWPKLGPPPPVGPPYIPPPEPVWVVLDPALLRASEDTVVASARNARPTARRRATIAGPAPEESGPQSASAPDGAIPGEVAPPPELSGVSVALDSHLLVDLPAADRRQLDDAARRNLAAADSLARQAGRSALPPREREKLENALGLVRQARDALQRGDLRAAANLAYKARLLAGEVAR